MTIADCWRAAGRYDRAEQCEATERAQATVRAGSEMERYLRMQPIRAKHAARRAAIAEIRAERTAEQIRHGRIWDEWYMTHDCTECRGSGHNDAGTAPCPHCKYGRTIPEPTF